MQQALRPQRPKLTVRDIARIRVETMCDERTIRKWAKGEPVREANSLRIERAINKLGIA